MVFQTSKGITTIIYIYIHTHTRLGYGEGKKGEKDRRDPLFPLEREFQRDERVMARATPAIQVKEPDVEESQERERVLAR